MTKLNLISLSMVMDLTKCRKNPKTSNNSQFNRIAMCAMSKENTPKISNHAIDSIT